MASLSEARAGLALAAVRGLGPSRARHLVDAIGSPSDVLQAFRSDPAAAEARVRRDRPELPALPERIVDELRSARPAARSTLRQWARRGIRVVAYGGPGYPARLKHLHDPPTVLWRQGPAEIPDRLVVTIVGTRGATGYGRRLAGDLAAGLAERGCCIVSGMAIGIDGAAHRGALAAGGLTVGVLGSGLDHVYPAAHRALYREVRESGALLSEFPPEVPPDRYAFPRRNRILAALAEAVVVVQAPTHSGALNTVEHALDIGREVLAVPGPVGPRASEGVHRMLREGAAPATRPEDVLGAIRLGGGEGREGGAAARGGEGASPEASDWGDPAREALRGALLEGESDVDGLSQAAGLTTPETLALLTRLELEGRVDALPGGRYVLAGAGSTARA